MKYYFSLKILFKSLSHQNKPFFYQLTIIRFQASKLRNKSFCRVSNFLKFIISATFLYFHNLKCLHCKYFHLSKKRNETNGALIQKNQQNQTKTIKASNQ